MVTQAQYTFIVRLLTVITTVMLVACFGSAVWAQSSVNNSAISIVNDRSLSARILGGGDAEPGDYPSVVALVNPGSAALDQRLFCGGTVVAQRWVLTAAHCVFDAFGVTLEPEFVRVIAGINDLAHETPETENRVLQIIVHPDYDRTLELPPNDIALLELESDVSAPSATLFAGQTNDYTDTMGFIAGWGAIEYPDAFNAVYPTVLQDAAVPIITNEVCNAPESYDGLIADRHLCAGFADGKIDACAGDSGGPLFININGEQVQAGITSFGIGCGEPLFYGIYTNVSHFIPWLSDYIAVPYQSPELIAEREQQANPQAATQASDDGGLFGAAFGMPGLLLLAMYLVVRRRYRVQDMNSERISSRLVCRISRPFTMYTTYSQILTE